ncbi:MAG: hypothetical protein ACYTEX_24810 [Planctomycetota bacterium]
MAAGAFERYVEEINKAYLRGMRRNVGIGRGWLWLVGKLAVKKL